MKIDIAGMTPDSGNGHPRTTTAYAQQWRKALEEATWQARQRIAPGEAGTRSPDGAAAGAAAVPARNAAGAAEMAVVAPAPFNAAAPAAAQADALACAVADTALRAANVQRPVVATPFAALPAGEQAPAVNGASEAASAAPVTTTGWQALPDWPAVMVNAAIQGNRISVAMRDATVEEQDQLALFYRLRAQLRATGLELTSLTVNGHNVAPADQAVAQSA